MINRGRPKIKDSKSKQVRVRLTESQYDILKAFSKARDISMSEILVKGAEIFMKEQYYTNKGEEDVCSF